MLLCVSLCICISVCVFTKLLVIIFLSLGEIRTVSYRIQRQVSNVRSLPRGDRTESFIWL